MHILSEELKECKQCGKLTNAIDVHLEARLCPGECSDTYWAMINKKIEQQAQEV